MDIDRLRKDLEDYYTSAMYFVSKIALIDLTRVQNASDNEIIEIALENGFDLDDYKLEN
ncbi:MAG: hypothetical protein IKJ43_00380 [Bacilli bacterium]|nr:hypothetical protein [Bacilli bacterium]